MPKSGEKCTVDLAKIINNSHTYHIYCSYLLSIKKLSRNYFQKDDKNQETEPFFLLE
ncbi:hypothetical protein ACFP3I_16765 [Chryseobacterium arachidis]|uniref:hypothetical protein n=1 Tax=Chryseobacterium arachidis TaxID=1416778 RepID=UPI00361C218C